MEFHARNETGHDASRRRPQTRLSSGYAAAVLMRGGAAATSVDVHIILEEETDSELNLGFGAGLETTVINVPPSSLHLFV